MATANKKKSRTATHRPAARSRRFRHDDLVAVDLFSGFGGLTKGIQDAGFTTIMAANHNAYKVEVHEANHPDAEHWIADLVDPEAADYHSARDQVNGYGNAVSPQVGTWIGDRLRAIIHSPQDRGITPGQRTAA